MKHGDEFQYDVSLIHSAKDKAAFVQNPKPVRVPSLPRSLALLKSRKRIDPKKFSRAASAKAVEQTNNDLPRPLPTAWQKVLRTANGGIIEQCDLADGEACAIPSTDELSTPYLLKPEAQAKHRTSLALQASIFQSSNGSRRWAASRKLRQSSVQDASSSRTARLTRQGLPWPAPISARWSTAFWRATGTLAQLTENGSVYR